MLGTAAAAAGVSLSSRQGYSLCWPEGADLFLRSHFTGGVLQALLVELLKAAEGIITKSLLLGCLHSHRHLKSFSPVLDVPQHPSPFGC